MDLVALLKKTQPKQSSTFKMKFAEKLYPKGTFKKQKTDGAYINQALAQNLDVLARKIKEDMHFLGIITGNDMVGNGKTTMMTQVGTYLTYRINEMHKLDNTFTHNNLLLNTKQLAERSFELPRYSVVCLDEGDDLTTHGMKDLAIKLKRYFRKCRQLNQIILLILPSFFEFKQFYAMNRSQFLINVKFTGEFDRGTFDFYAPSTKKILYIKGKKDWNYNVVKPDITGQFFGSYCFFPNLNEEIKLYKAEKHNDMIEDAAEDFATPEARVKVAKLKIFKSLLLKIPKIPRETLKEIFDVDPKTIYTWKKSIENAKAVETSKELGILADKSDEYFKEPNIDEDDPPLLTN